MLTNANNENKKVCDGPSIEVLVSTKYDKTIKNNINIKDDTIRKRTSLIIVPQQQEHRIEGDCNENDLKCTMDNEDGNSANACINNITENLKKMKATSSLQEIHKQTRMKCTYASESTVERKDFAEGKKIESQIGLQSKSNHKITNRNSIRSVDSCVSQSCLSSSDNSRSSTNTGLSDDDVHNDNYYNVDNENFFDDLDHSDQKTCLLNASCNCDNSLSENISNKPLIKNISVSGNNLTSKGPEEENIVEDDETHSPQAPRSLPLMCDELLSPQEQPMGRRYAEVTQFKRSPDPSDQKYSPQHKLKSAAASVKTVSITTANRKSGLDSIENNESPTNNNNNHCRLLFNGFNSVRGSKSNDNDSEGGNINSCFDLNLLSDRDTASKSGDAANSQYFHVLDANDSSCEDEGHFEDDTQALLPKCLSRDELNQSRISFVSISDAAMLAEGETSSETARTTHHSLPCSMGLVERMLLTHPVWFLPGIQRSGAVHFLQGKEEGNFIVRGSSQPNTMAVSVRLPPNTGPYIEHYLMQSNEGILSLQSSRFKFDSIPALIAHYAQCCDELPVQLMLPRALRDAQNRQQLSSLALLGQEFWRYPMFCPKDQSESVLLDAKSPSSLTDTSGLGMTVFSSSTSQNNGEESNNVFSVSSNVFSKVGTPSDTASSVSSFTTSGAQQMHHRSHETVDSLMLAMSPVERHNQQNGIVRLVSTPEIENRHCNLSTLQVEMKSTMAVENAFRPKRPNPPNTLNLELRKPPTPPLRSSKSLSPKDPINSPNNNNSNPHVTTTKVLFSVDSNLSQFVEVTTPNSSNTINANATTLQTFSKRLSPKDECKDTLYLQESSSKANRLQSQCSNDSNRSQQNLLLPSLEEIASSTLKTNSGSKARKSNACKESKHYQESNILENPLVYSQSTLIDKISYYEDLWLQEHRTNLLTTFKPQSEGIQSKRPDLLAETSTIHSLNANLLSPTNSIANSLSSQHIKPIIADGLTSSQHIKQFTSETSPSLKTDVLIPALLSPSLSEDQFEETEVNESTEGDTTSTGHTLISRKKQVSPFYAEPADALGQVGTSSTSIFRRSRRELLLSALHRRSEPLKCDMSHGAGTLEMQKDPQTQKETSAKRGRERLEQWQLDNSWEFMSKQDNEDTDVEDMWKQQQNSQDDQNLLAQDNDNKNMHKPITVHQIIAERLPDLNLPELVRCSKSQQHELQSDTTQQQKNITQQFNEQRGRHKTIENKNSYRLSSYDNVERGFFTAYDLAQSDDGTVFSEPWDSSQWDSIMPTDDTTASDTINSSWCQTAISGDDNTMDEMNTKNMNQYTLKPQKKGDRHKVATILRNASIRDREILYTEQIKIIDPDEFFEDPVQVLNYREQQLFLSIMSQWEIVEHISECDKSDCVSQYKTELSTTTSTTSSLLEWCTEDYIQNLVELLFADKIQLGIALPNCLENDAITRTKTNNDNNQTLMSHPKCGLNDCSLGRTELKTETIISSAMVAIEKFRKSDELFCSTLRNCGCNRCCIKKHFNLDDEGNILLNINHIEECQGFGFDFADNKRLYQRCLKHTQIACDSTRCETACLHKLKENLLTVWNLLFGHPRNKVYSCGGGPGDSVRVYTLQLAQDRTSTFARNIENFISCTKESREVTPQVVMRNMRQFMNGMKNYLVKHGEGRFHQEVESARSRLKSDEFLNLDAILETVMHQLVVLPLREHLYGMFVDYYTRSKDIQLLAQNVKYACMHCAADFSIRTAVSPPSCIALNAISNLLLRLQEAELPLEKLELFLRVISTIFDATGCPRGQQLGADDFLPILVYVVAKCGFVGAEIEAEFMWGLLQPTLLNGEPGYYLTALSSAVNVLKSFTTVEDENGSGCSDWRSSSLPACSSVLRVIIPDECNGSLQTRTLPVRPHTTTREVCRIIAHKARITNPQDYALFKLVDGEETLLSDLDCPQDIRFSAKGRHCMLAYKRIDAKIAWPTASPPNSN